MLVDTSATETEDETKQSPKRGVPSQRGRKKKIMVDRASSKEMKRKGRRRRKSKDKTLNRLTSFKARKNATNNNRKLNLPKPPTPKVQLAPVHACVTLKLIK